MIPDRSPPINPAMLRTQAGNNNERSNYKDKDVYCLTEGVLTALLTEESSEPKRRRISKLYTFLFSFANIIH